MFRDIVRTTLRMQHRVAAGRNRVHHVGYRRQQLVFDVNQSGSIFGDIPGIGDHQHHRFANVTDFSERDASLFDRRVGKTRQRSGFLRRILAGNHGDDAGQRQRGARVDRFDARVRVRRPQHRGMRHVRKCNVINETAAPDQEARVFLAQHASADDIEPLVRPLLLPAGRRREDLPGFRHYRLGLSPRISSTARSTELTMSS